jgi:hypothetical protein
VNSFDTTHRLDKLKYYTMNNLTLFALLLWLYDANAGFFGSEQDLPVVLDICPDESIDLDFCTSDFDNICQVHCTLVGQDTDRDSISCLLVDCAEVSNCRDHLCLHCADEFDAFSNCVFDELCLFKCVGPDDTCYDKTIVANDCSASIRHENECLSCYYAGQTDPSNSTCYDTDCDAYEECLEKNCWDCADEYMALFACQDEAAGCDVICIDTTSRILKGIGNKPRHLRGHGNVKSPRTKSH